VILRRRRWRTQRDRAAARSRVRNDRRTRCPSRRGAQIGSLTQAAAAGDLTGWLTESTPLDERVLALVMAADHQRLAVIDQLLDTGVPIDAEDPKWGRQALRIAASNGRANSVRHLLTRGADPGHVDPEHGLTALQWFRRNRSNYTDDSRHADVGELLCPSAPDPNDSADTEVEAHRQGPPTVRPNAR